MASDKLPWPGILAVEPIPGAPRKDSIIEDRLDLCERGYAAGNPGAVIAAVNICEARKMPLPGWLHKAVKLLLAELIEPQKKGWTGRHSRVIRRMNDMLTHIRRMRGILGNAGATGAVPPLEYPTTPEIMPGGPRFGGRRLSVLAALPSIPVTTATADVPQLTSNSDGAAVQATEGAQKAETTMSFANVVLRAATVAHFINASRQLLADSPMLADFINRVMIYGALKKFENLIVSGDGGAVDQILGLMHGGTAYAAVAVHPADAIGESATTLASEGYSPDLVIMNPFDLFGIASAGDSTGRYIGPGWAAAAAGALWGIPTVTSAALPLHTALVLDSNQVSVLDREQASVQIGYTGEQFTANLVTVLAELRGQLAIFDPHAIQVLTLPATE